MYNHDNEIIYQYAEYLLNVLQFTSSILAHFTFHYSFISVQIPLYQPINLKNVKVY